MLPKERIVRSFQGNNFNIKHNPKLRQLYYNKLSQGKTGKQALIYVAKKLTHMMLSMLKSGETYNPERVFKPVHLYKCQRAVIT